MPPDIIVLNGPSSAGKTSIAQVLQEALPVVYLNFGIDAVLYALPPSDLACVKAGKPVPRGGYEFCDLAQGHHAAAAALLGEGARLILDTGVWGERRADLEARVAGFDALWVGVTCEPAVLRAREEARGDRAPGMAERQAAVIHEDGRYDLMVDTTEQSPEAAAAVILQRAIG